MEAGASQLLLCVAALVAMLFKTLLLLAAASVEAAPHNRRQASSVDTVQSSSISVSATPVRNGRTSEPSQQQARRPQFAQDGVDAGASRILVLKPLGSVTATALAFYVTAEATPFGHLPLQLHPSRHAKRKGPKNAAGSNVSGDTTSYTTTGIVYATAAGPQATPYIAAMQVNGVNIKGTFNGQRSAFLPAKPFMPGEPTASDRTYGNLLGLSFLFYEEQRLGLLESPRRAAWRNSSALHDGLDHGLDLSGGFADAGDYLKCVRMPLRSHACRFTHPLSSSFSLLTWGCTDNWKGVKAAGQLGYLDQASRWAFDWLIKANPNGQTLYVCVVDPGRAHTAQASR